MANIKIDREDVKAIMKTATGTMFNVVFEKKDGTLRSLNGRLHVKKHVKGGVNTTAHIAEYMKLYDVVNKGYRNVHTDRVKEIHIRGKKYVVKEAV